MREDREIEKKRGSWVWLVARRERERERERERIINKLIVFSCVVKIRA